MTHTGAPRGQTVGRRQATARLFGPPLLSVMLCACVFDGSGSLGPQALDTDGGRPSHFPEASTHPDQELPPDAKQDMTAFDAPDAQRPDATADAEAGDARTASPDGQVEPDSGESTVAVSAEQIGTAFAAERVRCVLASGEPREVMIPIVDRATVKLLEGSRTLAAASASVHEWVGALPSVTLVWDPNGCSRESWSSAGFLIRGATLDGEGRLLLAPTTTADDFNLLNVREDGSFQDEWAGAPDQLDGEPALAPTVIAARQAVIRLAHGRLTPD